MELPDKIEMMSGKYLPFTFFWQIKRYLFYNLMNSKASTVTLKVSMSLWVRKISPSQTLTLMACTLSSVHLKSTGTFLKQCPKLKGEKLWSCLNLKETFYSTKKKSLESRKYNFSHMYQQITVHSSSVHVKHIYEKYKKQVRAILVECFRSPGSLLLLQDESPYKVSEQPNPNLLLSLVLECVHTMLLNITVNLYSQGFTDKRRQTL